MKLLLNRIRTPDGTILTSRGVHDYQEYTDKNGRIYMVDGGNSYLRRNIHAAYPHEELSLYSTDPFERIREEFKWGTRGKGGDQPLEWVKLKDLSTDHIKAIISTQYQIPEEMVEVFRKELKTREVD